MIINWLVFSDLHFQFDSFRTKIIRKNLLSFLKKEIPQTEFMIITGDCFYKGKNNVDAHVNETVDYVHKLVSACTCEKDNVYITPGNHDLIRTEARLSVLSYYTGIDYDLGEENKERKRVSAEAHNNLFNKQYFHNFFELYQKIVGKSYGEVHHLYEKDEYRVININTCVLSGGYYNGNDEKKKDKRFDEGHLSVLDYKLQEELEKIQDDEKLNIAFMHHGMEYFREEDKEVFQKLMEDSYIDIIFTGHNHCIGVNTYDDTRTKIREFTCGAPIIDDYSEPSFFLCSFDTDSKKVSCTLYSCSEKTFEWDIAHNIRRDFKQGVNEFIPQRFKDDNTNLKNNSIMNQKIINNSSEKVNNHFSEFGIFDALPMRDFIALRNKLIEEADGNVTLAGQSLENTFDVREDSESIVERIKDNKKITCLDIFLSDPIVFDSSSDTYEGETPIARINNSMNTILHSIAEALDENQRINIYFIPSVQLDHIVLVNDTLLLRNTLLWTNNSHYKATPLVCKNIDDTGISESIVKDSMYYVYKEYLNKLKEISVEIDIWEKENNRAKESLAKICHSNWRKRLYKLRTSGKLKGKIVMYKLYRTQLISELHSTWNSRFRSFSNQINWADEFETSLVNEGQKTSIKNHTELYISKNLLDDSTQKIILPYVQETEKLLDKLVKKYDNKAIARIYPSLNIGISDDIIRLAGGFATGMLVVWKCGTPIVPIDSTVNVCSSSYYQFDPITLKNMSVREFFNKEKIKAVINKGAEKEGLTFNFTSGNHFLLLCQNKESKMYYLILHSSAKSYKDNYMSLYPTVGNWYSDYIETYKDEKTNRYIRYLKDVEAERFIRLARMLNKENEDIHNWFAANLCEGIHFTNRKTYHHYGMPTDYSIAIGTYVIDEEDTVPIFSREGYPICMFRPDEKMWSIELEGKNKFIVPHSWGQNIRYQYFESLQDNTELAKCKLEIVKNNLVLKNDSNHIIKEFIFSNLKELPKDMIEVRNLCSMKDIDFSILQYDNYISGTIEEILEPVALFSKNHSEVKYYE